MKNRFVVAAAAAAMLCACSENENMVYRPYPQILPQHVQKLAVRPFVNKTEQFAIEDKFNLQLVQQFQQDGTYPVVSESEAAGIITGEIWRYTNMPIQYDSNQVTTAYKLTVMFKVRFIDKTNNTILWEEPALEGVQIYSDASLPGGMTELAARQAIWERMSQDIVKRTVIGFGAVTSKLNERIVGGPQSTQVRQSSGTADGGR